MPINIKDSIESSTIKGSLSGNASTATKATQDSAGQQINKTYIKGLSVSGKTITYTRGDGTTGTITTQDTNTTYSTGTASALGLTKLYTGTGTATDGTMTQNAINTALNGKAASNHTHSYLPLNGGSVTGRVNVGGRCILPPVYDYDKGTLINICAAAGPTMVTIHVTGNSYGAGLPINSMYHFYDYTQNEGIKNASGVHNGYNIGNMTVYRNNGRLYAWIKQPASYQTFNIEIIANKTLDASISNAAVHTSGNTNTITITPSVASMNGHTHNYAGSSSAGGAANSANTLATARTINGTSFNGSANITTANWGTARTLTIGNTGKSVNGSGNVSWSLSEIGAAPASHTHNYVPTSDVAATATANKVAKLDGSADINVRLLRSNYTNQSTISGALAYRVNNGSDNYLRFCSDTAAIRTWLGVAASSHTHNYAGSSSAGGAANSATKLATARTIKVGNTGKSFDGSGGITFTLAEMGIVSGTSAPSNSDGRADGTVYFRYA